mgnify:CR=1 FL=1
MDNTLQQILRALLEAEKRCAELTKENMELRAQLVEEDGDDVYQ